MNLFGAVLEGGSDRDGYASRELELGPGLGAVGWGGTIYELGPGERVCPYHWHVAEEEWLLVLSGTPTLREPGGEQVLRPWDVAVFRRGADGAHEVRNDTGETARVLMLSTIAQLEMCVYPDSGKIGAWWQAEDGTLTGLRNRPDENIDYWDGGAVSAVFNLLDGPLSDEEERPDYRNRRSQVGAALGAELLGATIYETPPGEKLWPYHWELGCEEFAVVVTGTPTLRTPDGERVLAPGDLIAFPEGEAGAHQLRNDSDEPFRVLIGSTKSSVYVAGYPDSGKLLIDVPAHGRRTMLRASPELDYWQGES